MVMVVGKLLDVQHPERVEMRATLVDVTGAPAVGYVPSLEGELVQPVPIRADEDGGWSADLTPNSLIVSDAGDTLWAVQEGRGRDGTPIVTYIAVPEDGEEWWAGALRADVGDTQTGQGTVVYLAGPKGDKGDTGPQPALGSAGTGPTVALRSDDPTTTNSRTPTTHASTHGTGGTDPVTVAQSQVTGLAAALAALLPLAGGTMTGTTNATLPAAGTVANASLVSGDQFDQYRRYADGKQEWGNGSTARDTNLYRDAANSLKTDDALTIALALRHLGSTLGFYGATAVAKPTVTGSRGGNAALASLLTALASLGLITDSTTA